MAFFLNDDGGTVQSSALSTLLAPAALVQQMEKNGRATLQHSELMAHNGLQRQYMDAVATRRQRNIVSFERFLRYCIQQIDAEDGHRHAICAEEDRMRARLRQITMANAVTRKPPCKTTSVAPKRKRAQKTGSGCSNLFDEINNNNNDNNNEEEEPTAKKKRQETVPLIQEVRDIELVVPNDDDCERVVHLPPGTQVLSYDTEFNGFAMNMYKPPSRDNNFQRLLSIGWACLGYTDPLHHSGCHVGALREVRVDRTRSDGSAFSLNPRAARVHMLSGEGPDTVHVSTALREFCRWVAAARKAGIPLAAHNKKCDIGVLCSEALRWLPPNEYRQEWEYIQSATWCTCTETVLRRQKLATLTAELCEPLEPPMMNGCWHSAAFDALHCGRCFLALNAGAKFVRAPLLPLPLAPVAERQGLIL